MHQFLYLKFINKLTRSLMLNWSENTKSYYISNKQQIYKEFTRDKLKSNNRLGVSTHNRKILNNSYSNFKKIINKQLKYNHKQYLVGRVTVIEIKLTTYVIVSNYRFKNLLAYQKKKNINILSTNLFQLYKVAKTTINKVRL